MISASDTPTAVYLGNRVAGTYISFVADNVCTVYYHTWGYDWYWKSLVFTALEVGAMTGHTFVFVNNDNTQDVTFAV